MRDHQREEAVHLLHHPAGGLVEVVAGARAGGPGSGPRPRSRCRSRSATPSCLQPTPDSGVVGERAVVHHAEIGPGHEGVRVEGGDRRLGGHAGVGHGHVARPRVDPVAATGVGRADPVSLTTGEHPPGPEHVHLRPRLTDRGHQGVGPGLGQIDPNPRAPKTLDGGSGRTGRTPNRSHRPTWTASSLPSDTRSIDGVCLRCGPVGHHGRA